MRKSFLAVAVLAAACLCISVGAAFAEDAPLTLENIKKMAEAAEKKAAEINVPMVFAVVDQGGNLIYLERMSGALLASINIAQNKAYSAVSLKMPTSELAKHAQPGASLYGIANTNDGKIVIFGGGFPYYVGGEIVGAVGVSGGSVEEDMSVATAALDAVGAKH